MLPAGAKLPMFGHGANVTNLRLSVKSLSVLTNLFFLENLAFRILILLIWFTNKTNWLLRLEIDPLTKERSLKYETYKIYLRSRIE